MNILRDDRRSRTLLALVIFFMLLGWFFFGLRMWSRRIRRQKLQLNDWYLIAALITEVGQTVVQVLLITRAGEALPTHEVTPAMKAYGAPFYLPGALFWAIPLFFVKMSILHFYTTIFTANALFRRACHATMILILLILTIGINIICVSCTPIQKFWDPSIPGGCLDNQARALWLAVVNLITDLIIVALPMPVIWRLRMSVGKRALVSCIFGAALLVCGLSIARVYWLVHTPAAGTWTSVAYSLFTELEPDLGIVVACLPLLQPLVSRLTRRYDWFHLHSDQATTLTDNATLFSSNDKNAAQSTRDGQMVQQRTTAPPTASERLRRHLWHIPEMNTTNDSAEPVTRDSANGSDSDLEGAVNRAGSRARNGDTSLTSRQSLEIVHG